MAEVDQDQEAALCRLGPRLAGLRLLRRGEFPCRVLQLGRRTVVPRQALEQLLAGEEPPRLRAVK